MRADGCNQRISTNFVVCEPVILEYYGGPIGLNEFVLGRGGLFCKSISS